MSLTQQAHQIILDNLQQRGLEKARYSIDATCGNGHDTLFLAKNTSEHVFAFDVQEQAINQTKQKIDGINKSDLVTLFLASHEQMDALLNSSDSFKNDSDVNQFDAIIFNLGYLPRSDKSITTQASSTLKALEQSIVLLAPEGAITLLCYPGHDGGSSETSEVVDWLNEKVDIGVLSYSTIDSVNATNTTPFLIVIRLN